MIAGISTLLARLRPLDAPAYAHSSKYRRDIDGLRAFAVMPVLLFHFGVDQISGGFAGVDVFFVISGYLIAGSLLSDLERGEFSLINFYWRRFRRILPALTAVLLASSLAAYFLMPSKQFVSFGWSLLASMTFWSNIYFWHTIDYFSVSAELTPLLHTWSLAVEEQYYIFAPIAMYLIYRFLGGRWALVVWTLIVLSFALSVYGLQAGPRFTFYWLPTRAWELLLGASLALCPLPKLRNRWLVELAGLAGMVCLAIAYFTLAKGSVFPATGALLPCFGAFLLIYAGEHRALGFHSLASRFLELRPFVLLGLISYSLYLVHWPLVSFATHKLLTPVDAPVLLTVISILLAAAMWKWIEQPFRTKPGLKSRKATFSFAAASTVVCAMLAVTVVANNGLPGRATDYTVQKVETVFWRNRTCFFQNGQTISAFSVEECTHDLGFGDSKILLWGDSYAAQYVGGLEGNAEAFGSNVVQMTHAGCPPVMSFRTPGIPSCAPFNRKAMALAKSGQFETIVLTALWDSHNARKLEDFQNIVAELRDAGLSVVVIGQSPRFLDDVQRIAAHARNQGLDPSRYHVETSSKIRNLVQTQTEATGQLFLDPIALLCEDHQCPLSDDVDFMAFDEGHMGQHGATIAVGNYLGSFLEDGQSLLAWGQAKQQTGTE